MSKTDAIKGLFAEMDVHSAHRINENRNWGWYIDGKRVEPKHGTPAYRSWPTKQEAYTAFFDYVRSQVYTYTSSQLYYLTWAEQEYKYHTSLAVIDFMVKKQNLEFKEILSPVQFCKHVICRLSEEDKEQLIIDLIKE